jgi:integrase
MKYIKLDLSNRDCRGIHLIVDDDYKKSSISNINEYKITSDFSLLLRITYQKDFKRLQKKKVVKFNKNTTLLKAVDIMIEHRSKITNLLKDGTIEQQRQLKKNKLDNFGASNTLDEIFESYIKSKQSTLKEKTIKSYISFYKTWIKDYIGKEPIEKITQEQLQNIVNTVLDKRAPKTARTLKEVLNPIFKQYWRKGEIFSNPVELLTFKKFDNVRNPNLTDEEIKNLYNAIYQYDVEPFRSIFIWLATGRRVNEVLTLKWKDLNIEKREFTINSDNNKAGRSMTYKLDDDLLATLENIEQKGEYIFPAIKDPHKKMHNDTIKRHWKKILANANISNLRIHDLRHIVGLKLVNAGVSLEVIASVLGHTTVSITKRYSNVRTETAADAMKKFKSLIHD